MMPPRCDGKFVHVGMAAKVAPEYRRRYRIDSAKCRIVDLKIDQ